MGGCERRQCFARLLWGERPGGGLQRLDSLPEEVRDAGALADGLWRGSGAAAMRTLSVAVSPR